MNYTKAFSYVFDDQDWIKKILIAGLISLIPVVGWIYLMGWSVEIVRRTKAHRTDILPATHFSYFLTLGLKMTVVMLIYSLPVNLFSLITKGFSHAITSDESGMAIQIFFASAGCLSGFGSFLLSLAVSLLVGYGMIRLAETDQIKPCLEIGNAIDSIRNNFKPYLLVLLTGFVIGLVEISGLLVCFVGLLFTVPYGFAVSGHLYGQLWDNLNVPEKQDKVYDATGYRSRDTVEAAPAKKNDNYSWQSQTAVAPVVMNDGCTSEMSAPAAALEEPASESTECSRDAATDETNDTWSVQEEIQESVNEAVEETTEDVSEEVSKDDSDEVSEKTDSPDENQPEDLPNFE